MTGGGRTIDAVVFVGPTLDRQDLEALSWAVVLPPVAQGDVVRTMLTMRPRLIGIIDGAFETVPAVWHKEILWAMALGTTVFGSASMGALRAAELRTFGMIGVGSIYDDFASGALEDDDAVAVVHGPPEVGYVQLSEALVDIRATLDRALAEGLVDRAGHAALFGIAKRLFYKQRTYDRILDGARAEGLLDEGVLSALARWLPAGRVSQKRADARLMIDSMAGWLHSRGGDPGGCFAFEPSALWQRSLLEILRPAEDRRKARGRRRSGRGTRA